MQNKSLGQKIRMYRERAELSQMELELEIGASPGSLSRIENGQTNPTKETIILLGRALKLDGNEIISLFGIEFDIHNKLADVLLAISDNNNSDKLLMSFVKEVEEKLGYITVAAFTWKGDRLYARYLNINDINKKALELIGVPFDSLYVSRKKNEDNLILRSAVEQSYFESDNIIDFSRGAINDSIIKIIAKMINFKSGIAYPLSYKDHALGAIYLGKSNKSDYRDEMKMINTIAMTISRQIFLNNMLNAK